MTTRAKHAHYFRDVSNFKEMDIYLFLKLFGVTDPCIQHAIKKLVVPGMRGAGKVALQDIREAMDSLNRFLEIHELLAGAEPAPNTMPGPLPVPAPGAGGLASAQTGVSWGGHPGAPRAAPVRPTMAQPNPSTFVSADEYRQAMAKWHEDNPDPEHP